MDGLSLRDLERLFGLDHRAIVRWWVEPKLLAARRWSGRGPHCGWLFAPADVETFIRQHVYAVDVTHMQPGHPFTRLAALEAQCQRWRSVVELADYLGVPVELVRSAARDGLIPHRRRPGAGCYGEIRVRADEFPKVREILVLWRATRRPA